MNTIQTVLLIALLAPILMSLLLSFRPSILKLASSAIKSVSELYWSSSEIGAVRRLIHLLIVNDHPSDAYPIHSHVYVAKQVLYYFEILMLDRGGQWQQLCLLGGR